MKTIRDDGAILYLNGREINRNYLAITYQRNLAADDVIYEVQVSENLASWTNLGTTFFSTLHNGDGTETVTRRSTTPMTLPREFIRLQVRVR